MIPKCVKQLSASILVCGIGASQNGLDLSVPSERRELTISVSIWVHVICGTRVLLQ